MRTIFLIGILLFISSVTLAQEEDAAAPAGGEVGHLHSRVAGQHSLGPFKQIIGGLGGIFPQQRVSSVRQNLLQFGVDRLRFGLLNDRGGV